MAVNSAVLDAEFSPRSGDIGRQLAVCTWLEGEDSWSMDSDESSLPKEGMQVQYCSSG